MRKIAAALLCLVLLAASGCAAASVQQAEHEALTIAVASDLHYLSPSLTDNGVLFQAVVSGGDGKLMLDVEAVTEAFAEQMIGERPDLLILCGDLSFNGERQSHLDLAAKLKRIEEAGVRVLVLPGNHDLNGAAARFEGESCEPVDGVDAAAFREIYADFGYREALSVDELSGSYVFAPCSGLRILMLDTNSYAEDLFPEESLSWLEKQMKQARREGAELIAVSHQNLLVHNGLFLFGYQILNAERLETLLYGYGVRLNLSGHMHIQHAAKNKLTEVLTSPLPMPPCRCALVRWERGSLVYEARSVDVTAWAASRGLTDEKYRDFEAYSRDFFRRTAYDKALGRCLASGMERGTAERIAACFADTNLAYFTGEPLDRDRLRDEIAFMEAQAADFSSVYLRSILEDEAPDPLTVVIREGESG